MSALDDVLDLANIDDSHTLPDARAELAALRATSALVAEWGSAQLADGEQEVNIQMWESTHDHSEIPDDAYANREVAEQALNRAEDACRAHALTLAAQGAKVAL